jgi:flagellum-specific peptidoglycan hydrolase FlgJ
MAEKNDNSALAVGILLFGAGFLLFYKPAAAAPPEKIDYSLLTPTDFIKLMYPFALKSEKATGVPALVTLAQAIVESGWGKSFLSREANNFFGIKRGTNWTGNIIFLETWECSKHSNPAQSGITDQVLKVYTPGDVNGNAACNSNGSYSYRVNAGFRQYPTAAESFTDHGNILRNKPQYAKAFQYTDNPVQFAKEIAAAGYATSPTYGAALIQLMEKIQLVLS